MELGLKITDLNYEEKHDAKEVNNIVTRSAPDNIVEGERDENSDESTILNEKFLVPRIVRR